MRRQRYILVQPIRSFVSGVSTDIYGLGLVNESSEGFDQEEYNRLKHAIEEEGEFPQEPPEVKYVKVYRDRYPLVVLRSGRSGDNSSRKGLYEKIVERMIDLAEAYHWVTGWYSFLCKATAGECLLLLEDFQEFMKLVEPNK